MSTDLLTILLVVIGAAAASILGGLISLWRTPTSLFMSAALGFASGILLGTISFEMLPQAIEITYLPAAVGGFAVGFTAVYGYDEYVHRGKLAGPKSEQRPQVERFYHEHPPHGGSVTVLAGGTSAEEVIEGLSIGVGAAIKPGLGLLIGIAIAIDNLSESLSIGIIIRSHPEERSKQVHRVLGWTGLIGAVDISSALIGWFFFRGLPQSTLGFLFAVGAGAMFYLTITDLIPQAEERQYQQSSAIFVAIGYMAIFVLTIFI